MSAKILDLVLTIFVGREAVNWVKQHRRAIVFSVWAILVLSAAIFAFMWYVTREFSGPQPYCVGCLFKN